MFIEHGYGTRAIASFWRWYLLIYIGNEGGHRGPLLVKGCISVCCVLYMGIVRVGVL